MKRLFIILPLLFIIFLFGCGSKEVEVNPNDIIVDATQFSNLTSSELRSKLGEPQSTEPYEWKIPSTGKSTVGELYTYENGKFEFVLFNDKVVRLNVNSGVYWGYDDSTFKFINDESILKLFGVSNIPVDMRQTEDTGYMKRYERVGEGIYEVEIFEIEESTFGFARITYDKNFF